jgi:glutamate-1-semialdehyde aminotransferase
MNNKYGMADKLKLDVTDKLWAEAINCIPSGVQTFSKAPFQHVNGVSPKLLVKAKGCHVWDADGNEYIDYMLGLGPIILGHADDEVNAEIMKTLDTGISMSLAHPLETELANELCNIIKCAEKVRFGKNGSDVTTAAVRAARAITGRDKIACCGYHGWQDWYIGTTGRNKGVPNLVRSLTHKFEYNNPESLEKLFSENPKQVAAVIMEPVNFYEPKGGFLEKVKRITHENGALLIFDEVITGFRMAMGGAQEVYDVVPDLACFGKAMANGMPISAVVGKAEYMNVFDEIFFSSTFGGELASIAAALTTIRALKERKGLSHINDMGRRLKKGYRSLIKQHDIADVTEMIGFNWWPEYIFYDNNGNVSREVQSLFQQEIVRRGILTRAGMMLSVAHEVGDIDHTLDVFDEALSVVVEAMRKDKVLEWLDGDVIQPVIRAK